MKKDIHIPSFKINLISILSVVVIGLLAWNTFSQWNDASGLKQVQKQLQERNKELLYNVELKNIIINDNKVIVNQKTDSINKLILSFKDQEKELKVIQWRYAKLKKDYNNSSTDDKNQLFTELINN